MGPFWHWTATRPCWPKRGTGSPAESASLSGLANPLAAFLLDWPDTVQRDLKVIDEPGTKHWAVAAFVHWLVARSGFTVSAPGWMHCGFL